MVKLGAWETRMLGQVALCASVSASLHAVCEGGTSQVLTSVLAANHFPSSSKKEKKIRPTR